MGFMMFRVYKIESTDVNSIFQTWLGLLFQIESLKMMRSIAKLKVAWGDPDQHKSRHAGETEESSTGKQYLTSLIDYWQCPYVKLTIEIPPPIG